ncbi:hypothetical protein AAFN47_26895 [Hoeflea sp. CAU 1731]
MALLTHLDVVNAACARIGAEPIEDFDDDLGGGQAASLVYEEIVRFNLGIYRFSWATTIRPLSMLTNATPFTGWDYVYELPAERLGPPLYITDDITCPDARFSRYTLVGSTVHSDAEALFAAIKFLPDPHLWSATFLSATVTALASDLSYALANDRQGKETLYREAYGAPSEMFRGGKMGAAIREDGQATPPRKPDYDNNPLTRAWLS